MWGRPHMWACTWRPKSQWETWRMWQTAAATPVGPGPSISLRLHTYTHTKGCVSDFFKSFVSVIIWNVLIRFEHKLARLFFFSLENITMFQCFEWQYIFSFYRSVAANSPEDQSNFCIADVHLSDPMTEQAMAWPCAYAQDSSCRHMSGSIHLYIRRCHSALECRSAVTVESYGTGSTCPLWVRHTDHQSHPLHVCCFFI